MNPVHVFEPQRHTQSCIVQPSTILYAMLCHSATAAAVETNASLYSATQLPEFMGYRIESVR